MFKDDRNGESVDDASTPSDAILMTHGNVALHNAKVLVLPTAPGILATQ